MSLKEEIGSLFFDEGIIIYEDKKDEFLSQDNEEDNIDICNKEQKRFLHELYREYKNKGYGFLAKKDPYKFSHIYIHKGKCHMSIVSKETGNPSIIKIC